jgi:hypothetical protein
MGVSIRAIAKNRSKGMNICGNENYGRGNTYKSVTAHNLRLERQARHAAAKTRKVEPALARMSSMEAQQKE